MASLRRSINAPAVARRRANSVAVDAVHADFAAFLGASGEPPITFTARADGLIDGFNERWFKFTGLRNSTNQIYGWQSALHTDDILGFLEKWARSVRTGDPFQIECRLRRRDGEFQRFHCRALPYYDEKCVIAHWLGACSEIATTPATPELMTGEVAAVPACGGAIERVVDEVQRELVIIEQTMAAGDCDLLARIAQGLQSAPGGSPAESLREMAADLERLVRTENRDDADAGTVQPGSESESAVSPDPGR